MLNRRFGVATAALLGIASMVGSGVFTTTGFLLRDIGSAPAVLLVWVVGGGLALLGALAYAELASALPRNGGEYQLLSRIYHPAVGFIAGWVPFIAGFSAPMAAAAVAFGTYLHNLYPGVPILAWALGLLGSSSLLHAVRVGLGAAVQNVVTVVNVLLIMIFIVGAFVQSSLGPLQEAPRAIWERTASPGFAIGLVYVAFAYSGWNAAVYVAGELHHPERQLARALVLSALAVVALYAGLNLAFLIGAPAAQLEGAVDVGYVAALHLFGPHAASVLTLVIAVGLVTTVSALAMTGPRVYEAMGRDYPRLRHLSQRGRTSDRGPVAAIGLQMLAATLMVPTASYDALLTYMGVVLSASAGLTILGVIVLRWREPELPRPYRMWGYPVTPALALALSAWMLIHALWQRPAASLAGVTTAALGFGLYVAVSPRRTAESSK